VWEYGGVIMFFELVFFFVVLLLFGCGCDLEIECGVECFGDLLVFFDFDFVECVCVVKVVLGE